MKKHTKLLSLLLCGAMTLSLAACGDGTTPADTPSQSSSAAVEETPAPSGGTAEKAVGKVEVVTEPDKTTYWIDEEFSPEGGMLQISYRDGTTEEIPMTDPSVEIGSVKTSSTGRKQVKVTVGGKSDTFYVVVAEQGEEVTFHLNYDGAEDIVSAAEKDAAVAAPADPTRDGYTFGGWYTDAACTVAYDFESTVTGPLELYAFWKEDGTTYHSVTYSLNYYGQLPDAYTQQVKDGENARDIALAPQREEFTFDGWYTDEAGTAAFSAGSTPVTGDMTVYAKWTKTKSDASTYVFEAENTNLTGKEGPGMSGSAAGASMVVNDMKNQGASGGKFVSYLYKEELSLDFYLASSEAVSDATLAISISAEMDNIALEPENYTVEVNGTPLDFAPVMVENGGAFTDGIVINNVSLAEGANTIRLVTSNSVNPMGEGVGTYQGTAPMVDCIKLTTSAVVTWDGTQGLPVQY